MYHKYEYIVSIRGLWGWGHPPLILSIKSTNVNHPKKTIYSHYVLSSIKNRRFYHYGMSD